MHGFPPFVIALAMIRSGLSVLSAAIVTERMRRRVPIARDYEWENP